jgi:hypothetical protein
VNKITFRARPANIELINIFTNDVVTDESNNDSGREISNVTKDNCKMQLYVTH